MPATVERISPQEARRHLESDSDTVLVCAYDSDEKFRGNHLEGALSLSEFQGRADSISKDWEVIFYCA